MKFNVLRILPWCLLLACAFGWLFTWLHGVPQPSVSQHLPNPLAQRAALPPICDDQAWLLHADMQSLRANTEQVRFTALPGWCGMGLVLAQPLRATSDGRPIKVALKGQRIDLTSFGGPLITFDHLAIVPESLATNETSTIVWLRYAQPGLLSYRSNAAVQCNW